MKKVRKPLLAEDLIFQLGNKSAGANERERSARVLWAALQQI